MRVLVAHGVEATLLEDADRREVVESDPRMKRPGGLEHEKFREGSSGDALAPMLATHPIADEALGILFPTADVPNNHAAHDDGAGDIFRAENLCAPVGHERWSTWDCPPGLRSGPRRRGHPKARGAEPTQGLLLPPPPQSSSGAAPRQGGSPGPGWRGSAAEASVLRRPGLRFMGSTSAALTSRSAHSLFPQQGPHSSYTFNGVVFERHSSLE